MRVGLTGALTLVLLGWMAAAAAQAPAARKDLALRGDAQCTRCHGEEEEYPVLAIGKTRHGVKADARTPTCTSCHGESDRHVNRPPDAKERPKPDRMFTRHAKTPMEERSAACLACHQGGKRIHWQMSAHAGREVSCASCHQVHQQRDTVREKLTQTEVCFGCHKEQRAQYNRQSRHPIREGKVLCSDCHNPHGSAGEKMMVRDGINDTCYACHMEKRGPFVRTHQPVQENCALCHNPHGSTNDNLLRMRPPFLCQQCHEPTSHRSNQGTFTGPQNIVGGGGNRASNFLARGCLNCHTNIHGTNNPTNSAGERTFRR